MPRSYSASSSPDYTGLVKFLIVPFLEAPDSLRVDCEQVKHNSRVWLRLAFDGTDKGKVYGRGGHNLQSIRTVLETAANAAGQLLYLDIYEAEGETPRFQRRGLPYPNGDRQDKDFHSRRKHRSRRPVVPPRV